MNIQEGFALMIKRDKEIIRSIPVENIHRKNEKSGHIEINLVSFLYEKGYNVNDLYRRGKSVFFGKFEDGEFVSYDQVV